MCHDIQISHSEDDNETSWVYVTVSKLPEPKSNNGCQRWDNASLCPQSKFDAILNLITQPNLRIVDFSVVDPMTYFWTMPDILLDSPTSKVLAEKADI
jgi:hypothetical protein